jgi:hypothetical protein
MAITRDFTSGSPPNHDATASNAPTIAVNFAVSAGDLMVVTIAFESSSITVTSVTDTSLNTYVQAGSYARDTNSPSTSCVFHCLSVAAASANTNTITVHLSGSITVWCVAMGATLAGATWALDKTAGTSGTTGNPASGSVTTTSANEYAVSCCYADAGSAVAGSGWTSQFVTSLSGLSAAEDQILTSTATLNGQFTQGSSGNWSAIIATYSATTSSGTPILATQRRAPGFPTNAPLPGIGSLGAGILKAPNPGPTPAQQIVTPLLVQQRTPGYPPYGPLPGVVRLSTSLLVAPNPTVVASTGLEEYGAPAFVVVWTPETDPDAVEAATMAGEDIAGIPLEEPPGTWPAQAPPELSPFALSRDEDFGAFLTIADSAGPTVLLVEPPPWLTPSHDEDFSPLLTVDDGAGPTFLQTEPARWVTFPIGEDFAGFLTIEDAAGPTPVLVEPPPILPVWTWREEDFGTFLTVEDAPGPTVVQVEPPPWLPLPAKDEDFSPTLTIDDATGAAIVRLEPPWSPLPSAGEELGQSVTSTGLDEAGAQAALSPEPPPRIPDVYSEDFARTATGLDESGITSWTPEAPAWVSVAFGPEDFAAFPIEEAGPLPFMADAAPFSQVAIAAEDFGGAPPLEEPPGIIAVVDATTWTPVAIGEDFAAGVALEEYGPPPWLSPERHWWTWQGGTEESIRLVAVGSLCLHATDAPLLVLSVSNEGLLSITATDKPLLAIAVSEVPC